MKKIAMSLWMGLMGLGFEPTTQAAISCDESCLRTTMDNYLDAMLAHDPSRLARANKFRFTENGVEIALKDGLWTTATGMVGYRIYVPDPATQTIAFLGNVTEYGKPVYFGVRLTLTGGRIAEAETLVGRGSPLPPALPGNADAAWPTASRSARASLAELTPDADRVSRAKLIELSEKYFDALQDGDGDLAPFADECVRIENGIQVTGMAPPGGGQPESCYDNIEHIAPLARIVKRRVMAVDEARNTVIWAADFAMPAVDSPSLQKWLRNTKPDMKNMVETTVRPSSGPVFELFRIRHGQIAEIEAVFYGPRLPYGFGTGWDHP